MEKALIFSSANEVKLGKLLRFIIPTYLTSLFNTLYTMVDGIFVSSYVGTNALAAINIVYPIVNILTGIALIFGTGGSAVAAILIGAQKRAEANRAFSVSTLASLFLGCLVSLVMIGNLTGMLDFLGATEITINDCKVYALWWLFGTPLVICKELFTYFIRVDGSPTYSFLTALLGGICNIILDYILVAQYNLGIHGAAAATIIGLLVSSCMGIFYFLFRKKQLTFTVHGLKIPLGIRCMVNGVSEFVNQLAIAITTIVFNRTAMTFAGEDGIAAVSIIMYLQFLVIGIYFGVSMGMAPPLGYAVWGEKSFRLPQIGTVCISIFPGLSSASVWGNISFGTAWSWLFFRCWYSCLHPCCCWDASLRHGLFVFRHQYLQCDPLYGLWKGASIRHHYISSFLCSTSPFPLEFTRFLGN